MKKMLVVLLVAVLSLTMCAFAEGIDLASLSDDELLSLQSQIQNEIAGRQLTGGVLSNGNYVVGVDFPAGAYNITHLSSKKGMSVLIVIYQTEGNTFVDRLSVEEGETGHINLEDGQYIKVSDDGSVIIAPATPIIPIE